MSEDKRVRYTKMFLTESIIKLLKEKPLSRITVTELCKEAEINRSTYYTYYLDPYDQLEKLESEFINGLKEYMKRDFYGASHKDLMNITISMCEYYYKNRELYLILNCNEMRGEFEASLMETLKDIAIYNLKMENLYYNENIENYAVYFVMSGSNTVIYKWLNEDYEKYSPKEIAEYLFNISYGGLRKINKN